MLATRDIAITCGQRRSDAERSVQPGLVRRLLAVRLHRLAIGIAGHREVAAYRVGDDVGGKPVRARAGCAKWCDRGDNKVGKARVERFGGEERTPLMIVALDKYVGVREQLQQLIDACRCD